MRSTSLPTVAFCLCAMVWGTTFLAIRIGNESTPALWSCALRLVVATFLLIVLHVISRQPWPKGPALRAACLYGLFEFGVGLPLLYWGEKVVSSGMAAVLYAVCPVSAMFAAKLLGIESLNRRKLTAAVLALAGVTIIFWHEARSGAPLLGALAILIAAISGAFAGLVLQQGPKQNAIGVNAIGAAIGIVPSMIGSVLLGEPHVMPAGFGQTFPILYLAIMSSGVAFGLFAWLMNHWKATTVSFLGVIVPVIAVCAGAMFHHEKLSTEAIAGGLVVMVGVGIAMRTNVSASATTDVLRTTTFEP